MKNWRNDGKLEGLKKIGGMMESWRDDGRMYRSLVSSLVAGATGGLPLHRWWPPSVGVEEDAGGPTHT